MQIQKFELLNENFTIRTIENGGSTWFIAADICRILDIGSEQIRRLDDDEHTLFSTQGIDGAKNPVMNVVSEPGLYSLILGSRKKDEDVKKFKRWVTHDVIPQIRKTGQYSIATPRSLPEALRLAADLAEKLEAAKPAVEFVERYVEAHNTKGLREVAKVLGIPPKAFSEWLVEAGVLFRQGAKLLPYAEHMDKGRFEVKTGSANGHAFHQTRFTPEGIAWIATKSKEIRTEKP
jgi:phage antirepressor YoqD-like protein